MIIIIIYVLSMSEKLVVPEQTHRDIIPSQDMHKAIYIEIEGEMDTNIRTYTYN